jgi:hypothetical protein
MARRKNVAGRIIAAIFGLIMTGVGFLLIVNQAQGKGVDLGQDDWSINLIPGEFIVLMLLMIPLFIGVALLFYAISGKSMS